jgi:NAD(P)H-nitrite reductase large subunit
MTEDPIICGCNDLRKSSIVSAIKERGLRTAEQINKEFHLENACGACLDEVQHILKEVK